MTNGEVTSYETKLKEFFEVTLPKILKRIDIIEFQLEEISWKKSISEPKEPIKD